MGYWIRDISLADVGLTRIRWAEQHMLTLGNIRRMFRDTKPLQGMKISACLHVTKETANLIIALKEAGAEVFLAASNPLSTQDDVAAALVKHFGVNVYAKRGETEEEYREMIRRVAEVGPDIVIDDGGDLVVTLHEEFPSLAEDVIGGSEETTTGVIRERALAQAGRLMFPIIATNDAVVKRIVDNRFGTGQSAVDGIIRATNILVAGKNVVVAGYGYVGRGIAQRMRGLGAKVIVTEVDPIKALEAHYDGFTVMSMRDAARLGDIFITATGNKNVIRREHIEVMKNGAILCNAGHFNVEIDLKALGELSVSKERINYCVERYNLKNGKHVYLLADGRLVNLVCGEGHPSEVMNISFSLQALVVKYLADEGRRLERSVLPVPKHIEREVARLTLEAYGIEIDEMTPEQEEYLRRWR